MLISKVLTVSAYGVHPEGQRFSVCGLWGTVNQNDFQFYECMGQSMQGLTSVTCANMQEHEQVMDCQSKNWSIRRHLLLKVLSRRL